MTLTEMKTALQRYGFDTSDPLTTWINWGMRALERAHTWPFLETFQTVPTVIGTAEYTIGNATLRLVNSLKINGDSEPLERLTLAQYHREVVDKTVSGHPFKYSMLTANTFRLYYVPDAVYQVDVYGRGLETDLLDASGSSTFAFIPPQLHMLVVLRAAVFGLMADNEDGRAQTVMQDYITLLGNAISDVGGHATGPEYVQDVMSTRYHP